MISQMMKNRTFDHEEQNVKIYGVVTAVVTNTADPDKKGRIKVKYAWLGEAKIAESDWARVVNFMAGNAKGAHFLPDVEDEVLVSFEHGNINAPFIVGALYNAKDKVIEENADGKNNIKMIKSRSGHTITLDDTDGEEKFIISDSSTKRNIIFDAKKKSLKIDNTDSDGVIEIEAKGAITIKSDDAINLEGKGNISIKSDKNVSIEGAAVTIKSSKAMELKGGTALSAKAGTSMDLTASSALNIKSSGTAKVEGTKLDLKASGMATLEATGIATVKGSLVKVN